jgi:transposase
VTVVGDGHAERGTRERGADLRGWARSVASTTHTGWLHLRYRYRIEPTGEQRQGLAKAFGCARVVYNDGLRLREDAYKAGLPFIADGELLRLVTTEAKKTPERNWLAEVSAVILQQLVAGLHSAYRRYFRALAEFKAARARGEKAILGARKPRLKSRHHPQGGQVHGQ